MKIVKTIGLAIFCLLIIQACGGDTTTANQTADHSGHDHNHDGHDHSGHDHSGHDHSGHDHSGHDHSGHNHDHNAKPQRSAEEIAKMKEIQDRKTKAQNEPATKAERATGDQLCACLQGIKVYSKIKGVKDQTSFDKAAGKAVAEVQEMQACHNKIVTAAIEKLPKDEQGVYAFRARKHANKSCFGEESDDIWFMMGKYVAANANINKVAPKRTTPVPKGEVLQKQN